MQLLSFDKHVMIIFLSCFCLVMCYWHQGSSDHQGNSWNSGVFGEWLLNCACVFFTISPFDWRVNGGIYLSHKFDTSIIQYRNSEAYLHQGIVSALANIWKRVSWSIGISFLACFLCQKCYYLTNCHVCVIQQPYSKITRTTISS